MAKDLVDILPKVGTMEQRALSVRDAESAGYASYMAKQLAWSEAQREENKKLAEIRFKRHGIDPNAQQPSTQAILDRPKEKDREHFFRPLVDCQIRDKDGNIDVAPRPVTIEEVSHVEAIRRRPKNSKGQSEKHGADPERKEAAVNAFLFSKPAELTLEDLSRITEIRPFESPPVRKPEEKEEPKSLAARFLHTLWKLGVPVHKATKKDFEL